MLTLEELTSNEQNKDHFFLAHVLVHALKCYNMHIQVLGEKYSPNHWYSRTKWAEKLYVCWVAPENEDSRDLIDDLEEIPSGMYEGYEIPPFSVPILKTKAEILLYIMDLLAGVFWFSRRSGLMYRSILANEYEDSIPVTREYFQNIVVGHQAGEWLVLGADGKVKTVLGAHGVTQLSYEELQAMSAKDKALARDRQNQDKFVNSNYLEKMKQLGYPYENTFDEYVRFLQTNIGTMNIGNKFTIKMKDVLDLFIPYPFN